MGARVPNVCWIIVTAFPRLVCATYRMILIGRTQAISLLVSYEQVSTRYVNRHQLFVLCHIYWQPVTLGQVASICTIAPFPRCGKYLQVTSVCRMYQLWERGLRRDAECVIGVM
jgi:hypothetical protein